MIQKFFVVGNWKQNPDKLSKVLSFHVDFQKEARAVKDVESVICPSFVHMGVLLAKKPVYSVGSQNISLHESGAHTGEVSVAQLADMGVHFSIVGHSEVRDAGESNLDVNKKIKILLKKKITPIVCVGEARRDVAHEYVRELEEQVQKTFADIPKSALSKIVIAYEPVWAIGAGATREATPEECTEAIILIRRTLADIYHAKSISNLSILYGGSVTPKNCSSFLETGMMQGFLVGRASLSAKDLSSILRTTSNFVKTQTS